MHLWLNCFFYLVLGSCFGIIYDVIKIFRLIFVIKKKGTIILDIIYFIVCSIFVFQLILLTNFGNIRFFILLIILVGYFVYRLIKFCLRKN
ncbi:MAG: spore cortex biosynthesis protein YabQ [Oscillospiraceae bacterium]|jgi:hypothetical protein|nr:spore cortex biosynthesis protein YabQ [Oscillospiraceae bacterium]